MGSMPLALTEANGELTRAERRRKGQSAAMRAAKRRLIPSRGSKNHHIGQCRPCSYLKRNLQCPDGNMCNCCHYDHPEAREWDAATFAPGCGAPYPLSQAQSAGATPYMQHPFPGLEFEGHGKCFAQCGVPISVHYHPIAVQTQESLSSNDTPHRHSVPWFLLADEEQYLPTVSI